MDQRLGIRTAYWGVAGEVDPSCHIVEIGNESNRFQHSSIVAKARIKSREQAKKGNKVERADVPF